MGIGEFNGTLFTEDLPEEHGAPESYPYTREDVIREVEENGLTTHENLAATMKSFDVLWNSLGMENVSGKKIADMMWGVRGKLIVTAYSLMRTEAEWESFRVETMKLQKAVQEAIIEHKKENDESK